MSTIHELVLTLTDTGRFATDQELVQLVIHVAQAPFSTRLIKVNPRFLQALAISGIQLPEPHLSSIELHLLKRVYIEQQWPVGTTTTQYLADLHQAVQHPTCAIYTYRWQGESFVGFLAPSQHGTNAHVRNPQPFIFVAYSADYGTIKTGFQASSAASIFTPLFQQLTCHR
jgi:hypothetical protein